MSEKLAFESMAVAEIKTMIRLCDNDPNLDFLRMLGKYRQEVVYDKRVFEDEEFDAICQHVLDDLDAEEKKNEENC